MRRDPRSPVPGTTKIHGVLPIEPRLPVGADDGVWPGAGGNREPPRKLETAWRERLRQIRQGTRAGRPACRTPALPRPVGGQWRMESRGDFAASLRLGGKAGRAIRTPMPAPAAPQRARTKEE